MNPQRLTVRRHPDGCWHIDDDTRALNLYCGIDFEETLRIAHETAVERSEQLS